MPPSIKGTTWLTTKESIMGIKQQQTRWNETKAATVQLLVEGLKRVPLSVPTPFPLYPIFSQVKTAISCVLLAGSHIWTSTIGSAATDTANLPITDVPAYKRRRRRRNGPLGLCLKLTSSYLQRQRHKRETKDANIGVHTNELPNQIIISGWTWISSIPSIFYISTETQLVFWR